MIAQGSDCSIAVKTTRREMDIPYAEETLREAVVLLTEEAAIEGDGTCKAIRKEGGVTGCVVTSLTIEAAPLLFYLALGSTELPVFVSETQNVYKHELRLRPMEDTDYFCLIQDRGGKKRLFESCLVKGFELRINRDDAIKLKLDLFGRFQPIVYPQPEITQSQSSTVERFSGDFVTYQINGRQYKNIYGLTLLCKKDGSTKTEVWIKRSLEQGLDIPEHIDELTITARLLRDKYEDNCFGVFRIILKRLLIISDETDVNSAGAVIGPLRYYVAGTVAIEVFTSGGETIE